MFKVGNIEIEKALLLAPMEDVTDLSFRNICKGFGADVVYTEFVNSEGLIRSVQKTQKKLKITDKERPVGIQIYGESIESMVQAARIAEKENPDMIDINAGCWVKKVANRGAGAGLLKDPPYMQKMVKSIVDAVSLPVTVKTRIGWDSDNILILDIAKMVEDAGAKALTVHCRTRQQGHSGDAAWEWIDRIKEVIQIPVVLNGGVFTAQDVDYIFKNTKADGVMIARGAIANPWIFKESKELLTQGYISLVLTPEVRIETALRHLKESIEVKGERRAILEFRKYYSSYLKGLHGVSAIRQELMKILDYEGVELRLMQYLDYLNSAPAMQDEGVIEESKIEGGECI
ncbi:MAG: tRNA dihydrouridine synthase DusB [Bacteroidota bacterium]|jgi:tRNA-dihydrouridine synthase B|nr:tRNA dihydrouridine synthase DusB [Ignavibacteria bacterium]MCU7499021.1 tRNA dihydrouridine synthase DusB [Ignavibacteria bacterium]MCU7521758.1 tRNA dihydrouridine synthase DusB [Ignavibacteria bacterium]MCU7524393.1 tRNA dihydrouridine synthase DusB [Ignavibacteria bacterium]